MVSAVHLQVWLRIAAAAAALPLLGRRRGLGRLGGAEEGNRAEAEAALLLLVVVVVVAHHRRGEVQLQLLVVLRDLEEEGEGIVIGTGARTLSSLLRWRTTRCTRRSRTRA